MYLPQGIVLNNRYEIESVLGHGGFGVTYLARDLTLNVHVAVKEYLPRQLATRGEGATRISIYTGEAREHFKYGLKKFLDEARAVAQFADHPNIVSARDYFEAHGTAYMVMRYVDGVDFKQYLIQQGGKIPFDLALKIMMPVMDALRKVHAAGLLHRDVSPDNIYLTTDGQVKLMDFGAARQQTGEHSKSLSVILKTGYAPPEQYRSKGKQGPWTDIYATAATLYKAITGQTPPDALDRMAEDALTPPSQLRLVIPPAAEQALLKALAIKGSQRYQTMGEFQEALIGQKPVTGLLQPRPEEVFQQPAVIVSNPPIEGSVSRPPLIRKTNMMLPAVLVSVLGVTALIVAGVYISGWKGKGDKQPPLGGVQAVVPDTRANDLLESGIKYLKEGNNEKAREVLVRAAALDANNAKIYFELGVAYFNLGRYREAVDANQKAVRLKPDAFLAYHNLGLAYAKEGRYQDAIPAFKEALRLRPDHSSACYNLGVAYALVGKKELAMEEYLTLKKKDPQTAKKLYDIIAAPSASNQGSTPRKP
jgi:serine/threonine protein kinase